MTSGYDSLPPGAIPLGYMPPPPEAAVPVVGGGGPGWAPYPARGEQLPPEVFSSVEDYGLGAAGASGVPRADPMMIKSAGVITRPSGKWPNPAPAASLTAREARGIISGPPVLDPNNKILVPEHKTEEGELVPAHWQYLPFEAIRLRVTGVSNSGPATPDTSIGAVVRVRGSSPFGGAVVQREFMLTPSMDACLMAGQYRNFEVSVMTLTQGSQVTWEWFNDVSGICAETELWSEFFLLTPGTRFTVPDGAVEAFFEGPTFPGWQVWNNQVGQALTPFDRAGTTSPTPAGTAGVAVRGQALNVTFPVGSPLNDVQVQFRLSPI